uniref:Acetyltransferase n=1 Tax=Heterorhabditis bacteriophora TaxID=37862 RepID=A0A1I7XTU7_HETBA
MSYFTEPVDISRIALQPVWSGKWASRGIDPSANELFTYYEGSLSGTKESHTIGMALLTRRSRLKLVNENSFSYTLSFS